MSVPTPTGNDATGQVRRLPAGRKAALASYVAEVGQVTVAQLAERFDVSPDTIRRDLDQLDADGVLIRTHGGAVSPSAVPRPDTGLDVRLRLQASAKEKIGALAAGLIADGSAIMINAGTTTLALVRHLRDQRELTVATNSLRIPAEISADVYRDLYVFGGQVRFSAQATVGPVSFQRTTAGDEVQIQCDLALVAVGAVHPGSGYSTSNLGEATMMAQMMDRASRVAVLADHSKFGRQLFAQVAELGRADYFVTDSAPPPDLAAALAKLPGWTGDASSITRTVEAPDFPTGIRIVDDVAEAAEAADHHPDIDIRWRNVTFTLSTHSAGGVTQKDVDLATAIDEVVSEHGAA